MAVNANPKTPQQPAEQIETFVAASVSPQRIPGRLTADDEKSGSQGKASFVSTFFPPSLREAG